LQSAQAARAVFQIRFEVVRGVVETRVTGLAVLDFCGEVFVCRPDALVADDRLERMIQRRNPGDAPRIEQARVNGRIARRGAASLGERAQRIPGFEADVP